MGQFCRFDINMIVDKIRVDLEVRVETKGRRYPERALYYWAREFSSALPEGDDYSKLPRVAIIGILDESLYSRKDGYHSEFRALEVTRHESFTNRMEIHCFEVRKAPKDPNVNNFVVGCTSAGGFLFCFFIGISTTEFAPNAQMTRAEVAAILHRFAETVK
jgi:hypothetical protein